MQVNTNPVILVNRGLAHTESGWPKEVDCTDMDQVIRFRRKVGAQAHKSLCLHEIHALQSMQAHAWSGMTAGVPFRSPSHIICAVADNICDCMARWQADTQMDTMPFACMHQPPCLAFGYLA